MKAINCRYFNGYKPCGRSVTCNTHCSSYNKVKVQILVVHLEALGAVLRATSILEAIHQKYEGAKVTWVTQAPAHQLLLNNPYIDRVLTTKAENLLELRALKFDYAFCIDKSLKASGVLMHTQFNKLFGFQADPLTGSILPANPAAKELWELGLSDNKKFFINKKSEVQLMIESLELGTYRNNEYSYFYTNDELGLIESRRRKWARNEEFIIGLNTGCSPTIPYKKLSTNGHRNLIIKLLALSNLKIVLLGGPEDSQRNQEIARGLPIIKSPTDLGLRDGMCSTSACDVVISGDSLGMHMAIAARKWVVAWFGPTCAHEIELYSRGEHIITEADCSPCWKRSCEKEIMCYDQVNFNKIIESVLRGVHCLTSLSKQPSLATSYSPSL